MSTRSAIWYKDEENKCYKGIYCHWDGYLSYVGKILLENYYTLDKVKELISYGFASEIYETIEKCIFFHRDRGEDLKNLFSRVRELSFEEGQNNLLDCGYSL